MMRTACLLIWLGGCGLVLGGDVAYHRVCCRQKAALNAFRNPKEPAKPEYKFDSFSLRVELLAAQLKGTFCVNTFGIGTSVPREHGVWPHVTHKEPRAFESTHHGSARSFMRSKSSKRGSRSSSREPSAGEMKCATVEVFFKETYVAECPLDIFTPQFTINLVAQQKAVRLGTGKGTWDGKSKSIVNYDEDQRYFEDEATWRSRPILMDEPSCDSLIEKSKIESAVREVAPSLDTEGVVRFLVHATKSVPSGAFSGTVDYPMKFRDIQSLDISGALDRLCAEMGRPSDDPLCLEKVPLKRLMLFGYMAPTTSEMQPMKAAPASKSKKSKISFFKSRDGRSKKGEHKPRTDEAEVRQTVNLTLLKDERIWWRFVSEIRPLSSPQDEHTCEYTANGSRDLDVVLTRYFLEASETSYAELHNLAMQKRLSTKKHWMLAACASRLTIRWQTWDFRHRPFLREYFSFELEGSRRVSFEEAATLADVNTEGIESPTCAVLAGVTEKPSNGEFTLWIAYFKRDERGKDKVFRSAVQMASPWEFFQREPVPELGSLLREAKERIEVKMKSPPGV